MFEDSPSGVRAGVAAGSPVIALTTGQQPEVLAAAGECRTGNEGGDTGAVWEGVCWGFTPVHSAMTP